MIEALTIEFEPTGHARELLVALDRIEQHEPPPLSRGKLAALRAQAEQAEQQLEKIHYDLVHYLEDSHLCSVDAAIDDPTVETVNPQLLEPTTVTAELRDLIRDHYLGESVCSGLIELVSKLAESEELVSLRLRAGERALDSREAVGALKVWREHQLRAEVREGREGDGLAEDDRLAGRCPNVDHRCDRRRRTRARLRLVHGVEGPGAPVPQTLGGKTGAKS